MKSRLYQLISLFSETEILASGCEELKEQLSKLNGKEIILSAAGQFKRGKTSLLNAVLGEPLLPVSTIPETAAVTKIRYGDAFRSEAVYPDGSAEDISREELKMFISERESGRRRDISHVNIWYPCVFLRDGITLADTPGVGSVHKHNSQTAYSFIEESDAVIFVLSADSPVNDTEREFLLSSESYAAKFYFVINKIDLISHSERPEYIDYCTGVLKELLKSDDISVFPVSALTGEGIDSLTAAVRQDFAEFSSEILMKSVIMKTNILIREAVSRLKIYLSAVSLESSELNETMDKFEIKYRELTEFASQTKYIVSAQTDDLIESAVLSVQHLQSIRTARIKAKLEQCFSESENISVKNFRHEIQTVYEKQLRCELQDIDESVMQQLELGYKNITEGLNRRLQTVCSALSQITQELLGAEYYYGVSENRISEKSDFHFRINMFTGSTSRLSDTISAGILTKSSRRKKIFRMYTQKLTDEFSRNTVNIIYNCRYKIQESTRLLYSDFEKNTNSLISGITDLLDRAKDSSEEKSRTSDLQKSRISTILMNLENTAQEINSGIFI